MQSVSVIGGGPAGAMAAERLAGGGAHVTVFEEKPGWEKPCGGGLPPQALRRYPFLLEASDPHRCVQDVELVAANGASMRFALRAPVAIYSRSTLNGSLLRRAEEAGAEVVQDRITNLSWHGSGWRLAGRLRRYETDFVVLAAGARTRLRQLLTEDLAARDFMLTFGYFVPGSDSLLRVQFFNDFEGYAWAFPRPDHLSVGICGKVGETRMSALRDRLDGFATKFGYTTVSAPVFSHLLPSLSVESWSSLRLAGPGWALVGDAGGLVDPVTGEGIYYAMRSGELLAECLREDSAHSYPERVWQEFGRRLARGARLSPFLYRGDFLGDTVTNRLVELASRSRTLTSLLQDLIEGLQSYEGLVARLYRSLVASLVETAPSYVRDEVDFSELAGS